MKLLHIFLLFCGLLIGQSLSAQLFPNEGTLIVTYQTTPDGQKLDRIRFWLINDAQERTLYPKKDEFVAHSQTRNERTVVITHLPAGHYRIEFLVPNTDFFFDTTIPREVELASGDVVKIDQTIKPRSSNQPLASTPPPSETEESDVGLVIINRPSPYAPYPSTVGLPVRMATFSLTSNQNRNWKLVLNGQTIYVGQGTISSISIPPGKEYYLFAEEVPGYSFYTSPSIPFHVDSGQNIRLELLYQPNPGYQDNLPNPPPPQNAQHPTPLQKAAPAVPTEKPQPKPKPQQKGSLTISSDSSQSLYKLSTTSGAMIGQGSGFSYTFKDLASGSYLVEFSSSHPDLIASPSSQILQLENGQNAQLKVNYTKMGRLTVQTTMPLQISIADKNTGAVGIKEIIMEKSHTFHLPEGRYNLIYLPLENSQGIAKPVEFAMFPGSDLTLELPPKESPKGLTGVGQETAVMSGLEVVSNLSTSGFYLENLSKPSSQVGFYKGKANFVPLKEGGKYRLTFIALPNYETPDPVIIEREADAHTFVEVTYNLGTSFVAVPAGPAIIGDPFNDSKENERPAQEMDIPAFEIASFEVTNKQYADWLNQAFSTGEARWDDNQPGFIVNKEGQLLCKTMEANPLAQLTVQREGGALVFIPLIGKENLPIIEVTWLGAQAYCQSYGWRLPSEAEWEKAAGMSTPTKGEKAKRYKYGFGQDTIDRSWANYREGDHPLGSLKVLTTPVGLYNGINTLPLTAQDSKSVQTHDAKSPAGAYDMSGNVWEWVESWNETTPPFQNRVVKGGCYDSLAQGVRVSERLPLSPTHSDIYTGFRPAR